MTIDELKRVIEAAGGKTFALEYAEALLEKFARIEQTNRFDALVTQFSSAREQGDFRGRVLEVNFADLFVRKNILLTYGAKQGMAGDVDFCWHVAGYDVFIEMKLLGQDRQTRDSVFQQLANGGISASLVEDDTRDVARIQLDLIQKSSTRKFNPKPPAQWLNIVGIDVSELQLGTADLGDCLLAAGGNPLVSTHCDDSVRRENVVGVFEYLPDDKINVTQKEWIDGVHKLRDSVPHPRDYIHGALFLFREPKERAALSYALSSVMVWNSRLVDMDVRRKITPALHEIIPIVQARD